MPCAGSFLISVVWSGVSQSVPSSPPGDTLCLTTGDTYHTSHINTRHSEPSVPPQSSESDTDLSTRCQAWGRGRKWRVQSLPQVPPVEPCFAPQDGQRDRHAAHPPPHLPHHSHPPVAGGPRQGGTWKPSKVCTLPLLEYYSRLGHQTKISCNPATCHVPHRDG